MDATTRWETEAIRKSSGGRTEPPKPTAKRTTTPMGGPRGTWVTLKEAEASTGIPSNTLRKWVRKDAVPSYLESDGDFALRMVDLDAVTRRANDLGRDLSDTSPQPTAGPEQPAPDSPQPVPDSRQPEPVPNSQFPEDQAREGEPATMLVPVDAWNKMLDQLGNLHEAGQQLAEARERAAKAETEASFLRRRLSEMREAESGSSITDGGTVEPATEAGADAGPEPESDIRDPESTTYWRYLTAGWRDRKRRHRRNG